MDKTLILNIQKGGLGDHLFYSPIPRIAKETGRYDRVYISDRSIFRSADNRKLVWELNPYVDGFTGENGIFEWPDKINEGENLLDALMLRYGLDDGKRFHEPEIYYKPKSKPELNSCSIYDPNYISYTGDLKSSRLIAEWFKQNGVRLDYQMKVLKHRHLSIPDLETFETATLFDLCSVLVSCRHMYCLTTGTATLAAALHIPVTVFYGTGLDPLYRHSQLHRYVHLGTDYAIAQKLKKQAILLLSRFFKLGVR
jgi:hypothetical protein